MTKWYSEKDDYREEEERCLAQECVDSIIKDRNLPPGTSVPVLISCPCKKCRTYC